MCSNLNNHLVLLADRLGLKVPAIELGQQCFCDFDGADVAVEESGLHSMHYNHVSIWLRAHGHMRCAHTRTIAIKELMTRLPRWPASRDFRAIYALAAILVIAAIQADGVRGMGTRNLQAAATQTPTPAPAGSMFITVTTSEPQINVRSGPSAAVYPIVGSLLTGSTAPGLGRSIGGDWIQIEYPGAPGGKGWVYSPLVTVSPGVLPILEPPPTPVPPATATIDPTLAAQFSSAPTATRLPTFTPAPPLLHPEFTAEPAGGARSPVALGTLILLLGGLGAAGLLISIGVRG